MIKIDIILKIALPAPSEPATALLDAPALSLPFPSTSGNLHKELMSLLTPDGFAFHAVLPCPPAMETIPGHSHLFN